MTEREKETASWREDGKSTHVPFDHWKTGRYREDPEDLGVLVLWVAIWVPMLWLAYG